MATLERRTKLWLAIGIGALWGFIEIGIGALFHNTAFQVIHGSLMTGLVALCLSFGFFLIGRSGYLLLSFLIVMLFKLLDAWLLHVPVVHQFMDNAIFGILLELVVFSLLFSIISRRWLEKPSHQSLAGIAYAIPAAGLFPIVKIFTGNSACTLAGSGIPRALYYAPLAIILSALMLPLGAMIGKKLNRYLLANPAPVSLKPGVAVPIFSLVMVLLTVLVRM
jgi:hypothetical protein